MSLAEEKLNSISIDGSAEYTSSEKVEEHIKIDSSRNIIVPESLKMIAVQYDKDVETREFDCPRYWDDGVDLYEMSFFINYILPNGRKGSYLPYNVYLDSNDDSIIHFTWKIEEYFTTNSGSIKFLIVAKKTNESGILTQRWSTTLNSDLYVSDGLSTDYQPISPEQEDLLTQAIGKIDELQKHSVTVVGHTLKI